MIDKLGSNSRNDIEEISKNEELVNFFENIYKLLDHIPNIQFLIN
jgi:hypothetical protein